MFTCLLKYTTVNSQLTILLEKTRWKWFPWWRLQCSASETLGTTVIKLACLKFWITECLAFGLYCSEHVCEILLCLVTSHKQVCFQQQFFTYSHVGFFRELWHTVHSWRSQTCNWGTAGVNSVCVFCLVAKVIGIKTKPACFPNLCKH